MKKSFNPPSEMGEQAELQRFLFMTNVKTNNVDELIFSG